MKPTRKHQAEKKDSINKLIMPKGFNGATGKSPQKAPLSGPVPSQNKQYELLSFSAIIK
jgi:hypothetical protein